MGHFDGLIIFIVGILFGMLLAFGLVFLFEFYVAGTDHPSLYSSLSIL